MKKKTARMANFSKWFIRLMPLAVIVLAPSCLESKPKVLGKNHLEFAAIDTANSETFRFNFAYRDPSVLVSPTTVYLQGIANSNTVMSTTCNGAGTGCLCEFLKADGTTVISTATSSYDLVGNFFSCTYNDVMASLAQVRLKNIAGTKVSANVDVVTTLTPAVLVGSDLDVNKVRTVKKYACLYNYLEKHATGTAPGSFNCTASLSFCGAAPSKDFCVVEVVYPFYLYSDNYSTNTYKQMSDQIYGAGATNTLCGRQTKQYDCNAATTGVTLDKAFGLYSEQTGNFQIPVLLAPAPSQSLEVYGYAAKVGTSGLCPPGMVKRDFYVATIAAIPETTVPADTSTDIGAVGVAPTSLNITRRMGDGTDPGLGGLGGYCASNICYAPRFSTGTTQVLATSAYNALNTPFCVIDKAILP